MADDRREVMPACAAQQKCAPLKLFLKSTRSPMAEAVAEERARDDAAGTSPPAAAVTEKEGWLMKNNQRYGSIDLS